MTRGKRPKLVEWLEKETGKVLVPPASNVGNDRHVSVRVPSDLFERVEVLALGRGETVSQAIRRLVAESLDRADHPDAAALDAAIAALQSLRRHSA